MAGRREEHLSHHPYLDHDGPIAFAHRGGNTVAPENTMAAFEHAVSIGYRHLETDVHLSADGVLVAFHDVDLRRTCGVDANISDLSWAEIAELRVDGTEPIPRMEDLLNRWPDLYFNIDCKAADAAEPLARLIESTQAVSRVCVGAFSYRRLRAMRKRLGPDLLTCLAPSETLMLRFLRWLPGRSIRAAQVPPSHGRLTIVTPGFLRAAHRSGVPVHVWTVNDEAEMNRLLDLEVDGIMTDDVELLKQAMTERGVWTG